MKNICPCHKCDTFRDLLKRLHDSGMTWNQIASLETLKGVPQGSLHYFTVGKRDLAERHKTTLGLHEPVLTYNPHKQKVYNINETPKDLFSMSKNLLLWKLNNREVME